MSEIEKYSALHAYELSPIVHLSDIVVWRSLMPGLISDGFYTAVTRVAILCVSVFWLILLQACSASESQYLAGDLHGINHTAAAINSFSVNGHYGKNIQPHGFGGGACCVLMPREWRPGLQVFVEWETDPDPYAKSPPLGTAEFRDFMREHRKSYRTYGATVDIPLYETAALCPLTIHFLPCREVKATTVCPIYGQPSYPVKEPLVMKEPVKC